MLNWGCQRLAAHHYLILLRKKRRPRGTAVDPVSEITSGSVTQETNLPSNIGLILSYHRV